MSFESAHTEGAIVATPNLPVCGLQFDSIAPLLFTPALQLLYINGAYATPPEYGRGRVYIDVTGQDAAGAMWLDVERFDATPADVPGWLDARQRETGSMGGIYVNRANLVAVELAAAHRPHYLMVATLDGTMNIPPAPGIGVLAAVQAFPAAMVGRTTINADVSVVVDPGYWRDHARTF